MFADPRCFIRRCVFEDVVNDASVFALKLATGPIEVTCYPENDVVIVDVQSPWASHELERQLG